MILSKAFTMDGAHETILRSGVYKSEFYMLSEQLLFCQILNMSNSLKNVIEKRSAYKTSFQKTLKWFAKESNVDLQFVSLYVVFNVQTTSVL